MFSLRFCYELFNFQSQLMVQSPKVKNIFAITNLLAIIQILKCSKKLLKVCRG
jgi:hypothetical protein